MCRFDQKVAAQQTRRVASTEGGAIRVGAPEGLVGAAMHFHCGAVAGKSAHGPMT